MIEHAHRKTDLTGIEARLDLKWAIVRRVLGVALLCFLVSAYAALLQSDREVRRGDVDVAEALNKHLSLQLTRIDTSLDLRQRFPDWDSLIDRITRPGQCVHFSSSDGRTNQTSCAGTDSFSGGVPGWFSSIYRTVLGPSSSFESRIVHRGQDFGTITVTSDPAASIKQTWLDIRSMLVLSGSTMALLALLSYVAIANALRPTKDVLDGVDRLAHGDLGARLPNFELVELQRIAEVFNALAANLETTLRERSELAAKLVDSQDTERRHLARELHDDLAQRISAFSALAASLNATAQKECPAMVADAEALAKMSGGMMAALRETLLNLRPAEIDDLGLAASLNGLIADCNARYGEGTSVTLSLTGEFSGLSSTAAAHIYRIVQEAITNAAKHARPPHIRVALARTNGEGGKGQIVITVADDGTSQTPGTADGRIAPAGFGLGLIGMRERVMALRGTLDLTSEPGSGTTLEVRIPAIAAAVAEGEGSS